MNPVIRGVVVMGYGNVGQALSPLLRKRFPERSVQVIDERMTAEQVQLAASHGFEWTRACVRADNFEALLSPRVNPGTLVINLATSISSHDVMAWCQHRDAFYLDTCIDPWSYQDGELDSAANTNFGMREAVMALQRHQQASGRSWPTAIVAHGANPGMVSVLVKQALLMMAERHLKVPAAPCGATEWALLAETLGVRVIQISERDTQDTSRCRTAGEFVNTWSVDGFVAEALQPIEMGWGTHEALGPWAQRVKGHDVPQACGVYAPQLGVHTRVRSWSPAAGDFLGHLISHNEAFSLASHLTVSTAGRVRYRPTVYYAYHPCDQAMASLALLAGGDRSQIQASRVLKEEIESGIDELGVWLLSDRFPGFWLGSQLSIARARALAPCNNATSLQVVGSMMGAMEWLMLNPRAGIVESEALDHEVVMQHARAYWEPMVQVSRAWHPRGETATSDPRSWCLDQFLG